jgi:hypothetical protein
MNHENNRKCCIVGCNNDLKPGAIKYCSIKCLHVPQKKSGNDCLRSSDSAAQIRTNPYCSIACAHRHVYRCEAEAFLMQGGAYGYVTGHFLRKMLKDYYGERCLRCGWARRHPLTGKVPVEVEHIDGDWQNNRLTNLTLLCPNCHALTPTFRGLNRGRGREYRLNGHELAPSLRASERAIRDHPIQVSAPPPRQLELLPPT